MPIATSSFAALSDHEATTADIALRCRAHNAYGAEQAFTLDPNMRNSVRTEFVDRERHFTRFA